jgi:peroxiredoxin
MQRVSLPCLLALLAMMAAAQGTPAAAERAKMAYQLGVERWMLETKLANTPQEREAAAAKRPDPVAAATEVWQAISPALEQSWTLPYSAWFIEMTDGLGVTDGSAAPDAMKLAKPQSLAIQAISKFHTKGDGLAPTCMALAGRGTPERLALLEKIRSEHPEPTMRGIAALATSLALKTLGDDPAVVARRIEALREAIIHSADFKLRGETTVGDIAKEELYIINNLTKGRTAPDLTGRDTAGRPIKLSDHTGKVVVLMFWSAADGNAREFIEFAAALHTRLRGTPVEILGVNLDATAVLRPLEADGAVTWRNFSDPEGQLAKQYRVGFTPLCFVIDRERAIQHIGPPGAFVELTATALLEPTKE